MYKKALLIIVALSPLASWALYKPMRVLSPELNGITCTKNNICIENTDRLSEATSLYNNALLFVNSSVENIKNKPRITFCSSEKCYNSFGFHAPAKATTVGISGIVVSPRGWNEYFIRHEIIHHLQSEKLGVFNQLLSPIWFKEGMAYSLSEDTQQLLEPWESHKNKFNNWYSNINKDEIWTHAKKL
ncbi:MAG: hypothetical protein QM484_09950 [Woeseiaceae bacterium]